MPMSSKFFQKDNYQSPDTIVRKKKVGLKTKITTRKTSPKKRKRTASKGRSESNKRSKDRYQGPKVKRKRIACQDAAKEKEAQNMSSKLSNLTHPKRIDLSSKQTLGETSGKDCVATLGQSNLSKIHILA